MLDNKINLGLYRIMPLLNLRETEEHVASINAYVEKAYGNSEQPLILTRREKQLIQQGLMIVRVDDAGFNYCAFSPNYPNVLATGDTRQDTLKNFYEAASDAQVYERRSR